MAAIEESNPSIWASTAKAPNYPSLPGPTDAFDVAVLGGGITGLTTALLLKREGLKVALVEAGKIAGGTTGHTSAKVTSLHGLTYARLIDEHGLDKAEQYAAASEGALAQVAAFVEQEGIDCNFERRPAFTYTEDPARVADIEAEVEAARQLGLPAELTTQTDLPIEIRAAVRFTNQAQFHPLRYCLGLAALIDGEGSRVFENTRVLDIEEGGSVVVQTEHGDLAVDSVVQATHLPIHDPGGFFAKTAAMRSYAMAMLVEGAVPEGMYLSAGTPTRSLRSFADGSKTYLIVGGESHKVGQDPNTIQRYGKLESWAREHFNVRSVSYKWSAQDYMPADEVPYIGRLTGRSKRLFVATGMKKWGMTGGTAAGMILRDLVAGRANPWAEVFDSTRRDRSSAAKLIKENASVARHFLADRLHTLAAPHLQDLKPGEGGIVKVTGGERVAAYRDVGGAVLAVSPTCTHLGCVVDFNTAEETWDCPCHGSRFDLDGNVIEGPAVENLARVEIPEEGVLW